MRKKWIILIVAFLLVILLVYYKNTLSKDVFYEYFIDTPMFCDIQGISPSITLFSEEIIDVSKRAGINNPILPNFQSQSHNSAFLQRTAFLPINEICKCRCTYFIYTIDDKICSLWIESSLIVNGWQDPDTTTIFSALDSQAKIQEEMKGKLHNN